jgi:signal transduction histidine kinase
VHDFRNPMSSVRLDAQMLERESRRPEGARPERLADLAGRIDHTVSRMDKVFQEFLYLARPAEEAQEPVDLAECVRECLLTLAPRLEQAGVTPAILWQAPPPRILASPFALRRALINVLLNAVQFSPAQGRIEVDARAAGNRVELDILDRGPGIPAPDRRRIFDMFVTTRPGGTGLGLFLARTAIRKCGGEIAALPREGGGACIRMTLKKADFNEIRTPDSGNRHLPSSSLV